MRSLLAAAAALTLLVGCQTVSGVYDSWFGSTPKKKAAELVQFQASTSARVVWQSNVGSAERGAFYPAVSGNNVYATGVSGQIAGFAANSGGSLGRFEAGTALSGGMGAGNGLLRGGYR